MCTVYISHSLMGHNSYKSHGQNAEFNLSTSETRTIKEYLTSYLVLELLRSPSETK